jgi:hypothetical protein
VGIRRDWSRGTKILFVKKMPAGDMVMGSGVLDRVTELAGMGEEEKRRCLENNWYGRMSFSTIARFHVPVSQTALAGQPPALLHGLAVDDDDTIAAVEALARGRLVT